MKRLALLSLLALGLLGAPSARGQSIITTYTFVTVDSIDNSGTAMKITGVLEGDAQPSSVLLSMPSATSAEAYFRSDCMRFATMTMMKPGQYQLRVFHQLGYDECGIARVNP